MINKIIEFLEQQEWDNLLAILLIGIIALYSMKSGSNNTEIATGVVSGLIGYLAKSAKIKIPTTKK